MTAFYFSKVEVREKSWFYFPFYASEEHRTSIGGLHSDSSFI